MRLMRITLNYPAYLDEFKSGPNRGGYWDQYRDLMSDAFGWADFLEKNFSDLGWEVWEPVTNFESNQRQWLKERGKSLDNDDNWFLEITKLQIIDFAPTVLFVDSYTAFNRDFLADVRERVPDLKLIVGWCGAPYPDGRIFEAFDVTLSNLPNLVESLQADGLNARLLWHGFEATILDRVSTPSYEERKFDLSFTGSVVFGKEFHEERLELLARLVSADVPIELYALLTGFDPGYGWNDWFRAVFSLGWTGASRERDLINQMRSLSKKVKSPVFGLSMYELLAQSRISLNNHIGVSKDFATNTRLYQITGCGSCLFTDWKPDLGEKFELDHEVVAFRCPEEAVEKAQYLIDNPDTAKDIAQAGQKRTLRDHSFRNRCEQLQEIFLEKL